MPVCPCSSWRAQSCAYGIGEEGDPLSPNIITLLLQQCPFCEILTNVWNFLAAARSNCVDCLHGSTWWCGRSLCAPLLVLSHGAGDRFESVQVMGIPWFSSLQPCLLLWTRAAHGRCIPVAVPQQRSYLCGRSTSYWALGNIQLSLVVGSSSFYRCLRDPCCPSLCSCLFWQPPWFWFQTASEELNLFEISCVDAAAFRKWRKSLFVSARPPSQLYNILKPSLLG